VPPDRTSPLPPASKLKPDTIMTTSVEPRNVPFFNYRGAFTEIEAALMDTIRDVVHRGAFILQKDLTEFERAIADYLGVKHAFGVGNATDGLLFAFRAAGLKPGDEVIFPSHTMVAGPAAVHYAGGIPVPVDIGRDGLLDPAAIEGAVTGKTKFIMPVQLNGRTCDMDAIQRAADKHGLQIIEDAAQGLGSKFRGRFAGTFGAAAAFSFYPAKILGCLGDGGMVVTNDDAVAEKIALLRDHGRNADGDVVMWGLNSRLDNLQAAILHLQFRDYDAIIAHRRRLAAAYHEHLSGLAEVTLPPAPEADSNHFDVFQNFEIEGDRRDELKEFLKARGIGTLIQWGGKAVHQYPKLGLTRSLPVTERFFTRCLMLPLNMMVTLDDAEYISATIREFYGR
jgi:dTDP-4-amino-4,6-dideoxygalactose transaminase